MSVLLHPTYSSASESLPVNDQDGSNSSFANSTSAQQVLDVPGFITFNVLMLVGVIVPVIVLDTLILVAFFVDKKSPLQVRLVLGNLISVGLLLLLILTLEHITALVLVTTNQPAPPRELCSFISWLCLEATVCALSSQPYSLLLCSL